MLHVIAIIAIFVLYAILAGTLIGELPSYGLRILNRMPDGERAGTAGNASFPIRLLICSLPLGRAANAFVGTFQDFGTALRELLVEGISLGVALVLAPVALPVIALWQSWKFRNSRTPPSSPGPRISLSSRPRAANSTHIG